jgi:hypothetical protein
MFLPGPTQLKRNSIFIFILIGFIQKIKRRSLDDVTKNSVFFVARLRNHGKYSHCWIDFVCDNIAHRLIE